MLVDIFIRTYHKDLPWLAHALRSIHKHVTGHRRIIVAIPVGQGHLLSHLTAEAVIEVPDMSDGYLGQQLTKMNAWLYTDADAVLFWDSDTVATEPINILEEYTINGKPIIYCTPYERVGEAQMWRQPTEVAMGFGVSLEYMRRLPLLYHRETLLSACCYIPRAVGKSIAEHMAERGRFSEFNAIGAFAHRFRANEYAFRNTDYYKPPPNKVRQYWSWGGITPEVQSELDKL
jgi:hypothetical protein